MVAVRNPRIPMSVAVLFASLVALQAAVVPGRWEKVEAQHPGAALLVTLASGQSIQGFLVSINATEVTLMDSVQGERSFPKSAVERITTASNVDDTTANGVALGAGIGLALALLSISLEGGETGPNVAGALVVTGVGAGTGYLVDKAHRSPDLLYRARKP